MPIAKPVTGKTMAASTTIKPRMGENIREETRLDLNLCWTCGSCDYECPVNIVTNRLQPRKIVRLANLGLEEEALSLPDLWYCLTCRHCNRVCPMNVQPADLIEYFRQQAIARQVVSRQSAIACRNLFARFQRVRWSLVNICRNGKDVSGLESNWSSRLDMPATAPTDALTCTAPESGSAIFKKLVNESNVNGCYTCGECASACPVTIERSTFDPMWFVRMATLGAEKELLKSPNIWLCIGCRRCSDACPQRVSAHMLIEGLKEIAVDENIVPYDFRLSLDNAAKSIYRNYLDEVDRLLTLP